MNRCAVPLVIGLATGSELVACAKLLGIDPPVDAPPDGARVDARPDASAGEEAQATEADAPLDQEVDEASEGDDGCDECARDHSDAGPSSLVDGDAGLPSVLYIGDSIAAETRHAVEFWMDASRTVAFDAVVAPAAAICDFLQGQPGLNPADKLRERVQTDRPNIVVFQFWGDASTQCMMQAIEGGVASTAYFQRYKADALSAVQEVEDGARTAGIPRPKLLWVLQGPDAASPTRTKQLNSIYEFVASLSKDRTSDAGLQVSLAADPYGSDAQDPRYTWTQYLPCTNFERMYGFCTAPQSYGGTAQLHKDTDKVHFCLGDESTFDSLVNCASMTTSPGVIRYGMQIASDANAWLAD
jgi:hypothetical protein